jgi:oxygen-independent coproporphyrinogen-3 oxidase
VDEAAYVDALLSDLEHDLPDAGRRSLESIFFGGGTPSLFSGASIGRLLAGVRERMECRSDMEVTLEANPGTVETGRFADFREAGVTRLSIGVQSFHGGLLRRIGRIHGRPESIAAAREAASAGFDSFNLDLMYGLPGQDLAQARADVETAIALRPSHISYYQMTLEPNTLFHAAPPTLPDEDLIWEMQLQGEALLARAGYRQYEVSAYALVGRQCRHNLNYWRFGDYLGLGAGAHGKTTSGGAPPLVRRTRKVRHPADYLNKAGTGAAVSGHQTLNEEDLVFEFMLNALRLNAGFTLALFENHTGLGRERLGQGLAEATKRGMIDQIGASVRPTPLGRQYLNDLIAIFGTS